MTGPRLGEAATVVATILGAAFGTGLLLIITGALRRPARDTAKAGWWQRVCGRLPAHWNRRRLVAALVVGVAAGALTRWPVAAVLTTAALLTLPGLLSPDRAAARRTERMEALALWTEMLRDTLSAAAGLEQAILSTADIAPAAVQRELRTLVASIRSGQPLPAALRTFADEVDDPLADVVVAALVMAAERQASQLAALLGELADSVREQVAMRQRIDAGRASIRTGVRVTVTVTLGMAVGLTVFNRPYLNPFNTVAGQLVLGVVGVLFAASFTWLTAIGRLEEPVRLLDSTPAKTTHATGRTR
ncbi:type II secretion system F family protein [Streptomyces sp. NA02950]|uniref:type II secretion system F family protein n=1 Tax=Streptomyces sp. NA02950 TaxID=2742137 RepID=UPI001591FCA8|nr:type II secretion system F family protein [Streptomyces sp. NA02950]QKV95949.1 type II secretion system F family protein [Streptomyces sp. NA02950]